MTNFLLAYSGGSDMAQASTEEQKSAMHAWGAWFDTIGAAVTDSGNPFGASTTLSADGSSTGAGPSGLTGYSILAAESLQAAADLAKGCPLLSVGGTVEVYEIVPVM